MNPSSSRGNRTTSAQPGTFAGVVRRFAPVLVLVVAAACGGGGSGSPSGTTSTTVAVVREILATDAVPPGAPGRTLTLVKYTIAPGAQLPAHVHPGVQLAAIQSGTLTYTVLSGTASVKRADGSTEAVTGPATIRLEAGDEVTETENMVHFGANATDDPVVILATLLTESGLDLAVAVTSTVPR